MDFNQVYRAPSVPKLSKRNISSSVIRGVSVTAAKPKLKTTKFSFTKQQQPVVVALSEDSSQSLVETNRILVEIQKQLAIDFSSRIAEEKEYIKKLRAEKSKKSFEEKEQRIEKSGKIGSFLKTSFDKVISPVKGVFDKIKEFFSLVLSGILLNSFFQWINQPGNKEKFLGFVDFVSKAFIPIVVGIIGYKVFRTIRTIYKVAKLFSRVAGRLFGFKPGAAPPRTPGPTIASGLSTRALGARNASYDRFIAGKSNFGDRLRLMRRGMIGPKQLFTKGGADALRGTVRSPVAQNAGKGILSKLGAKGGGKLLGKAIPGIATIIGVIEGIQRLKDGDVMGALLAFGTAVPGIGLGFLAADITRAITGKDKFDNFLGDAFTGRVGMTKEQREAADKAGTQTQVAYNPFQLAFNSGGTVPGNKSEGVDKTSALVTPGEEVVRVASANLFRPLLKDINENAGRMWMLFSQGVNKLNKVIDEQQFISNEFGKVLKEFNEYLENQLEVLKATDKPSAGNYSNVKSMAAKLNKVSNSPKYYQLMSSGKAEGGTTIIPLNLPAISEKPPEIKPLSNNETQIELFSSVNMMNPYMKIVPEILGIA